MARGKRQTDESGMPSESGNESPSIPAGDGPDGPQAPQGWPQPQPAWNWPAPQPSWPNRPARLPQILSLVAALLIAFAGGMVADRLIFTPAAQPQASVDTPLEGFDVYLQALRYVRGDYVDRDQLTDEQLLYGSIRGMVDSLGDTGHTRFLTPKEYAQLRSSLSGSIAGIGVLIVESDGTFVVERVIRDSPAEKGGIKAGDRITAVDGASVAGLNFDGLAAKIRGQVGTQVTVTVIHSTSSSPVDLTLTRADVAMPLVDWGMIPGTTIADIALYEFSSGAADQLEQAIQAATDKHATAIVLDLRGNPGGLADQATAVASQFLSSGVIYIEEDASGRRKEVKVEPEQHRTSLPVVVLVDGDTASAAEIVAGALRDDGRATVVGMNTVGTGTVLQPYVLSDGSVILLGVVDWLTPSGQRIFGVGIEPDTTVSMPAGALPLDPYYFDTMTEYQLQTSGDAQLLEAVKELSR